MPVSEHELAMEAETTNVSAIPATTTGDGFMRLLCSGALQITFRVFTQPRSRAKHGGGVSTPFPIYAFHSLRGKRTKRALREIALLGDVGHPVG
jgi:hypothetical protein